MFVQITKTVKQSKTIIIAVALVIVAVAILIGLISCSVASAPEQTNQADAIQTQEIDSTVQASDGMALDPDSQPIEPTDNADSDSANVQAGGAEKGSSASPASISTTSNALTTQEAQASSQASQDKQKRWVEDYEQIWVVDKEAWTENVPVYGMTEVSICNICGADITGNASAHAKAHMKAGEGSGHHSEVKQVITGYNSMCHEAQGHYESRVSGGHWEYVDF